MKTGIELITIKRQEQIEKHGRTVEKDVKDNSSFGQLIHAVMALIIKRISFHSAPVGWDETIWLKMVNKPYKERLVTAGALIAAEIDRLQAVELLTTLLTKSDK